MTERRPHWDDDLIEAVSHAPHIRVLNEEQTYAVIAAVEDWQAVTVVPSQVLDLAVEARRLRARIQAVRDQITGDLERINHYLADPYAPGWDAYQGGQYACERIALNRVLRVLDGDSDG